MSNLTGGTGDVNPQFFNFTVVQSGADTTTEGSFQLPIDPVNTGGARTATVIEVLKLYWETPNISDADSSLSAFFATRSGVTTSNNPATIGAFRQQINLTTSGELMQIYPVIQDLTDGAGHGVLVAVQTVFCNVVSVTTGNTNTIRGRMLYRYKKVGIMEYVGIVQSQQ